MLIAAAALTGLAKTAVGRGRGGVEDCVLTT